MGRVNASTPQSIRGPFGLDPSLVGTACCIVSALCYTAANICLRRLAGLHSDEMWVTCMKEVVTVAAVGPWLLIQAARGRPVVPPRRALLVLLLTGLAVQLAGNLSVQWAFGVVGLATTIPAIFGVMLTAGAVFGLVFLGERVPGRSVAAITLLIASILLLSLGAATARGTNPGAGRAATAETSAQAASQAPASPGWVLLGVGAGCLGGLMFATLSTVIRFTATARVPVASIVFVVTGMGVLSMGGLSLWRLGPEQLLSTRPEELAWMLAAGTFNLLAFLAITKGLQLTTVVHANVLNASQVAMAALAGVAFFHEVLNPWLILGIGLTILGVVLIGGRSDEAEAMESV